MSVASSVTEWTQMVAAQLPHLTQPQVRVLALWSLGMVVARSCALTAVSTFLAPALGRQDDAVRQQLREWCYEATAKRGAQRQALDVTGCFAPLLRWILAWWQGTQVALALDATTLGSRFVVLAVSVLYRGCAIPVAWTVRPATTKGAWKHDWLRLLRTLHRTLPRTMTVIVLADRGLYARWLFRRIVRLGWHPLLRINRGGTFRPTGWGHYRRVLTFAPQPGTHWEGTGIAFQGRERRLACTLLARWEAAHTEPWLLLTDLAPASSAACWYGLRAWIEQGFKLTKRGGWQWQRTRMTDPDRAARLWLAVAVATLWLVSVGGLAEDTIALSTLLPLADDHWPPPRRQRRATQLRLVSVFRRGWITILVALLNQTPLPLGALRPEPWPVPSLETIEAHHVH